MRPSPSPEGDGAAAAPGNREDRGMPRREDGERRRPMPLLLPAVGLLALIGVLYFTIDAFHRWDRLQACVTAGRRDCNR